jgi:hypothetical protein
MPNSITQSRSQARLPKGLRLNWGLILSMALNAVAIVGVVMLIKAVLTLGLMRLFGAE